MMQPPNYQLLQNKKASLELTSQALSSLMAAPIVGITEETNLFLALLLLPLLFFILRLFKPSTPHKSLPLPPGPRPWPILGNIPHMGNMPHLNLTNFAQIYGPLISLRLGSQLVVVGSSPLAATEILKTHDRALSARHVPQVLPVQKSQLEDISLGWAPDCDGRWKLLRTICKNELFSTKALESQERLREKKVTEMVKFLASMEGKVVDFGEAVFGSAFNLLSCVLISRDFIRLEDEDLDGGMKGLVRSIMELASSPNLSDFYPILGGLDLQRLRKKSRGLREKICEMWEGDIKERRERKRSSRVSETQDFLDVMIGKDFTDDQIDQLLLELFTAGTDTSSSTVEWAMAELMKNPRCMKKLEEELTIKEAYKDFLKQPNSSQLPYLQACVKETLRLHPPAPLLLPRRAPASCEVMNYTIPKNSQVLVNVWAIGRDPSIWDDPLVFNPDRFLDSAVEFKGNSFEFLPFGGGRRICPGLPMAARNVPLVLASLIYFFEWSVPQGTDPKEMDMSEKFGVTLQRKQPLLLIPRARK